MKKTLTRLSYTLLVLCFLSFIASSCKTEGTKRKKAIKIEGKKTTPKPVSNAGLNVPAEQGGAGFDTLAVAQGWETNDNPSIYGAPNAKKGGEITLALQEYPATLRTEGRDSRSRVISIIGGLIYEPLLGLDPKTLKYTPALATHWKISEDKMTYWFRLDPRAKFSDGKPVTSRDVVATWKLLMDDGIEDPSTQGTYSKYNEPIAESDYIVKVVCKEENWRNFLYIATSMSIFPNHYLEKIDGAGYLDKYQYEMLPGTGPYIVDNDDTKKGELLALKRRTDYWGKDDPTNVGTYNFDKIKMIFILDPRLELEKIKSHNCKFN